MLERVISGGQTGVEQAALRAAKAAGIATGGTAPRGWATEGGRAPWLAGFGLVQCGRSGYPPRAVANVEDSDGTLWVGDREGECGRLIVSACSALARPILIARAGGTTPEEVRRWVEEERVRVLNVAGDRESAEPGIGAQAEAFLGRVFGAVAAGRGAGSPLFRPATAGQGTAGRATIDP
jgi:hypothetical protein